MKGSQNIACPPQHQRYQRCGVWNHRFSARSAGLSDDELRDKFSELDMDESGKLSRFGGSVAKALREQTFTSSPFQRCLAGPPRQEAEEALRKMGRSHAEIEQELSCKNHAGLPAKRATLAAVT